MQIPLHYNRSDPPRYRGGYADVWKGEHQGCPVAVKVLWFCEKDELSKIVKVGSHSPSKNAVDPLTLTTVEVLQGGHNVEIPSPPKRAATAGSYDGQLQIRDGIRMDGKWEHQ